MRSRGSRDHDEGSPDQHRDNGRRQPEGFWGEFHAGMIGEVAYASRILCCGALAQLVRAEDS